MTKPLSAESQLVLEKCWFNGREDHIRYDHETYEGTTYLAEKRVLPIIQRLLELVEIQSDAMMKVTRCGCSHAEAHLGHTNQHCIKSVFKEARAAQAEILKELSK